jgi:hypothetical protein
LDFHALLTGKPFSISPKIFPLRFPFLQTQKIQWAHQFFIEYREKRLFLRFEETVFKVSLSKMAAIIARITQEKRARDLRLAKEIKPSKSNYRCESRLGVDLSKHNFGRKFTHKIRSIG